MKYLIKIFYSDYCKFAFMMFLLLSYLFIPSHVFYGWYNILAVAFMVSFSLVLTCIVRNVKEEIMVAKTYKSSLLGVIATALGLSALQVCGVGAPVCGASIGIGLFSSIMPAFFVNFVNKYAVWMLFIAILFQFLTLYYLKCFTEDPRSSNKKLTTTFKLYSL